MNLTDQQIDYIAKSLEFYGVKSTGLKEDLLDHICTYIETNEFSDFETAYKRAMQEFGGNYAIGSIQRETFLEVNMKNYLKRKRLLYIAASITSSLFFLGVMFKLFHWMGAMVLTFLSFISLIAFLIPVYLYQRYKSSERKLYE